jgi:hypothetical protein
VENLILSAVFLHHFAVHFVEVAFGFFDEFDDFASEVGGVLVTTEESDLLLELVIFLVQLINARLTHASNIFE